MIKLPKRAINISLIIITLAAAIYYFSHHIHLLDSLRHISPLAVFGIFLLYIFDLFVLVMIFEATVRLLKVKMPYGENTLINVYSLFMNFFIPGQTGPVYRGYYLKKNHDVKYVSYILASIVYYMVYGVLSLILIVAGSQPYWLTIISSVAFIIAAVVAIKLYLKRKNQHLDLSVGNFTYLLVATLLQMVAQYLIYYVELHAIKSHAHFNQVLTYTGTANLALFVALTPGAIGIREGFLLLSEKLHHITSASIVLANVVDRSVYIVFLLFLGVLLITLKVKKRLDTVKN